MAYLSDIAVYHLYMVNHESGMPLDTVTLTLALQERARAGDDAADHQPQSGQRQDLSGQSVALPAGRLGCPWPRSRPWTWAGPHGQHPPQQHKSVRITREGQRFTAFPIPAAVTQRDRQINPFS